MTVAFRDALRISVICSTLVMTLAACGADDKKSRKAAHSADEQRLAGEQLKDGCLKLGNPGQNPGQRPGQNPGYDKGKEPPVVIVPPKDPGYVPPKDPGYIPPNPGYIPPKDPGYVPPPPPPPPPPHNPCIPSDPGYPGQNPPPPPPPPPYNPIDIGDEPNPFPPTQQPYDPGTCGKGGKYCDDGGPGQWPGQTKAGGSYDRGDIAGCLDAFRAKGYDTRGQWSIDVREIRNVSVLSRSVIQDVGNARSIVIIKSVSVLGGLDYELLNPNALYCIKNVAVLENVRVTSCHSANVVFGRDVSVLSSVAARTVSCQY